MLQKKLKLNYIYIYIYIYIWARSCILHKTIHDNFALYDFLLKAMEKKKSRSSNLAFFELNMVTKRPLIQTYQCGCRFTLALIIAIGFFV